MTAASSDTPAEARTSGAVTGAPRRWLRLEGGVLLAGSLVAFSATGQPWWLVPLTILVPDVLAAGYLGGTRLGAHLYDLAHSTVLPAALAGLGWWQGRPLVLALGLVWLAHIGADRLLGYGLNRRQLPAHPPWPARPARSHTVKPRRSAQASPSSPAVRPSAFETGRRIGRRVSPRVLGDYPGKGDHATRGDHSRTKTSLSRAPERIGRGARRRARLIGAGVAAAALVSVLVPVLGAGPAGAVGISGAVPAVAWHRCPAGSAGAMAGGFLCAIVAAPLDYRNPSGPKISLAVAEHAATGPDRRGVIFFNPGGPGGPGTVQLPEWIGFFPKELLREYDIVSWDPRGSGASTAVQCFGSAAAENAFLGKYAFFPVGRGQQRGYIRRWREFGKICARRNGALLRHVSTADTARDLNLLRLALGQPKLNYLGISYGTFLGATYANLFPRRVGRLVLDGNVPPQAWTNGGRPNPRLSTYLRMGSDKAAVKALDAFLRICGQRSTQACAFSAGSPAATKAKWDALLARLRRAPITLGGTAYTYAEIVTDISSTLPFVQPHTTPVTGGSIPGWPPAAQGLQQLWLARNAKTAASPGTLPAAAAVTAAQPYGGAEQGYAVQCNEAPSPPASAYPGLQRLVLRRSGVIGLVDLWTFDEPCATWPVYGQDTYTGPWNAPTSPILVIGNTTDPFLPLRDAIAMTRQLGNARLLVVHGYGHTVLLNPSTCASTYMTGYFRTGALPPKGTVCHQNLPPFPSPAG